jgi:[ribosomal protein S5]-alanine N-acetyltransferase
MHILQTQRLSLRELTPDDAPFILKLVNEPTWLQFIGDKGVRTLKDAVNYILSGPAKSYRTNGFGLWLVSLKEEDLPIGICGLIKRAELEHVDIGFAYLPDYSGRGYAFEAASATLEYAKNSLALTRILAITNQDNIRSIKLLEKLGLQFEKLISLPKEDKQIILMGKHL